MDPKLYFLAGNERTDQRLPEWRQERPNYDIIGKKSNAAPDRIIKEDGNKSESESYGDLSDGDNKEVDQAPAAD